MLDVNALKGLLDSRSTHIGKILGGIYMAAMFDIKTVTYPETDIYGKVINLTPGDVRVLTELNYTITFKDNGETIVSGWA